MMQNLEVDFWLFKGINILLIIVIEEEFVRLVYQFNEKI